MLFLFGCFLVWMSVVNHSDDTNVSSSDFCSPNLNLKYDESRLFLTNDIVHSQSNDGRPVLSDSLLSTNQHFMIHYTTEGKNAVSQQDTNLNFIPDWIEKIADAFEISYRVEIEQLYYQLPPSFKNGTRPYDIYVVDLSNSYAITVTELVDSTAAEQKNVSSYILFDNDFNGVEYVFQGEDAIKTTAAHEFFHAIQLGYVFRKTDAFFFEMTAVWMEKQVFHELDNYLYYLDYFFAAPDVPLNAVSFFIPNIFKHIYGSCIFAFFIAEKFGQAAIRQIWEQIPTMSAMEAINKVFRQYRTNFESEFIEFCIWNFFTGQRARLDFSYRDSQRYPEIHVEKDTIISYYDEYEGAGYFLTSAYYIFHPVENGDYKATITSDYPYWRLGIIIYDENTIQTDFARPNVTIELANISSKQTIVIIPCNVDRFTNPNYVYIKHEREKYSFSLQREITYRPTYIKPFQIQHIYPNPFSSSVIFTIKKIWDTSMVLRIFNVRGQEVDRLVIDHLPFDLNEIVWHISNRNQQFSSGIYLCQFSAGNFVETKKVILNR